MVWINLYRKGIGDLELNSLYQVKSNKLGGRYIQIAFTKCKEIREDVLETPQV